jgi:hypothetical protein
MPTCPHCYRDTGIKVYVAARYEDRDDALSVKKFLNEHGFAVTSTWLLPSDADNPMEKIKKTPGLCEQLSETAEHDITLSDALVVLSPEKAHRSGTGGRHTEVGIAIALNKGIVLYGSPENVFHYRKSILTVPWGERPGLVHAIQTAYEKSRHDRIRSMI